MSDICIFSRAFYPAVGGLERIAQILATEAVRAGYEVEVVTDTPGLSGRDDGRFPYRITRAGTYAERFRAFRRSGVVLFMNVSLHGMLSAIAARTPVVFSHHGIYRGEGAIAGLTGWLKRQLTRFYPNISVSHFVADNIPAGSVVIPNAYDNDLFKQPALSRRDYDFVFSGRLVSDKGGDVCVRAFSRVHRAIPDASLTVIGDGPDLGSLRRLAADLGLITVIRFTGMLAGHELAGELQRHACMVVPSLVEEGFGISALEGIACCDTVIVFRRGGLPEAVGRCGLVVEPDIGRLADAMISVAGARRRGTALPGQADEETRNAHLRCHTPGEITRRYLKVLAPASRAGQVRSPDA